MNIRSFRGNFGGARGRGKGKQRGPNKGRRGPPAGPGGFCVCVNPECRHKEPHKAGVPCYKMKCPKCGSPMVRENG